MREAINQQDEVVLLASDFLGSFGGFFDQQYRDHDFLLGRLCGQLWLMENVWTGADDSDPRVQALVELIDAEKSQFLKEDPKPASLGKEGIGTIEKLIWRLIMILLRGLCASKAGNAADALGGRALAISVLWRFTQNRLSWVIALILVLILLPYVRLFF